VTPRRGRTLQGLCRISGHDLAVVVWRHFDAGIGRQSQLALSLWREYALSTESRVHVASVGAARETACAAQPTRYLFLFTKPRSITTYLRICGSRRHRPTRVTRVAPSDRSDTLINFE